MVTRVADVDSINVEMVSGVFTPCSATLNATRCRDVTDTSFSQCPWRFPVAERLPKNTMPQINLNR